jgi:hypothetical protein
MLELLQPAKMANAKTTVPGIRLEQLGRIGSALRSVRWIIAAAGSAQFLERTLALLVPNPRQNN